MAGQSLDEVQRYSCAGTHIHRAIIRDRRAGQIDRSGTGVQVQIVGSMQVMPNARGQCTDRQHSEVFTTGDVGCHRQDARRIEPHVGAAGDRFMDEQITTHGEHQGLVGHDACRPVHTADGGGAGQGEERVQREFGGQQVGCEAQRHRGAARATGVHLQQELGGGN